MGGQWREAQVHMVKNESWRVGGLLSSWPRAEQVHTQGWRAAKRQPPHTKNEQSSWGEDTEDNVVLYSQPKRWRVGDFFF